MIKPLRICQREVCAVCDVKEDRDHTDREADPAAELEFLLQGPLFGHLFRRLGDARANQVPRPFDVLNRLVRLLVLDVLDKTVYGHGKRQKEQRKDRHQSGSDFFSCVDPFGWVPGCLIGAAVDEDPDCGRCEQNSDQHAQRGLDPKEYLVFRHVILLISYCWVII